MFRSTQLQFIPIEVNICDVIEDVLRHFLFLKRNDSLPNKQQLVICIPLLNLLIHNIHLKLNKLLLNHPPNLPPTLFILPIALTLRQHPMHINHINNRLPTKWHRKYHFPLPTIIKVLHLFNHLFLPLFRCRGLLVDTQQPEFNYQLLEAVLAFELTAHTLFAGGVRLIVELSAGGVLGVEGLWGRECFLMELLAHGHIIIGTLREINIEVTLLTSPIVCSIHLE